MDEAPPDSLPGLINARTRVGFVNGEAAANIQDLFNCFMGAEYAGTADPGGDDRDKAAQEWGAKQALRFWTEICKKAGYFFRDAERVNPEDFSFGEDLLKFRKEINSYCAPIKKRYKENPAGTIEYRLEYFNAVMLEAWIYRLRIDAKLKEKYGVFLDESGLIQ